MAVSTLSLDLTRSPEQQCQDSVFGKVGDMRPRYALTLCAAVLLVIVAIANGTGAESNNLTTSPVASPVPPRCNTLGAIASPPAGTTYEVSGTPLPETDLGISTILWLDRITIEPNSSSGNWCYPGWWLVKVDSGTVNLIVDEGCVIVTRFSSLPQPSPNPDGCGADKLGPGSDPVELRKGDEFFAEDGRFVLKNESGSRKAVLLVAALAKSDIGCSGGPCP
jgi:hypothetical protein